MNDRIEELESRILRLESRVRQLKNRVEELEEQIQFDRDETDKGGPDSLSFYQFNKGNLEKVV